MKWLAFAAVLIPAAVVVCLLEVAVTGGDGPATVIAVVVALTAIPVAVGVAMMRYRLYEIDRLINRTLVYVALSAALAAIFAAVALSSGVAIGSGSTAGDRGRDPRGRARCSGRCARASSSSSTGASTARATRGCARCERFLADLRRGTRGARGHEEVLARGARRSRARSCCSGCPDGEVDVDADGSRGRGAGGAGPRPHAGAARAIAAGHASCTTRRSAQRPDLLESVIGAAGLGDRDRPPAGRGAPAARRGRGVARPHRHRRVRGAPAARARPPRRRPAAPGVDRPGAASRRRASSRRRARPRATLDATVGELARAIEELRELARGVRPAGLDDGLAARCRARVALAAADRGGGDRGALRGPGRDRRLLRRQRGARQRGEARAGVPRDRPRRREQRQPRGLGRATTAWAARSHPRARALPGSPTAWPPWAVAWRVVSPPGAGNARHGGASVRVVIAEDQALLREGLGRLFEDAGHEVVGRGGGRRGPARARSAGTSPIWRSSTCACRRRSPTRACARRSGCATPTRASACWCSPSTSRPRGRRARLAGRLRLPAEGPGAGRGRLPRRGRAGRRGRVGARPAGRRIAGRAASPTTARRADRARARGARPHGGGPHEHRRSRGACRSPSAPSRATSAAC